MNETRDERLRRMLREADLADGDTGLAMEEVRQMRRAVLTAIPETRRRVVLSPVLAGAAMAVLAAIVVLALWRQREQPPVPPREPARAATPAPAPPPAPVAVPPAEQIASQKAPLPEATSPRKPRTHRTAFSVRHDRIAASAPGGPAPEGEQEPRTRQIQFDTPGGTRVIWILTSNNAL